MMRLPYKSESRNGFNYLVPVVELEEEPIPDWAPDVEAPPEERPDDEAPVVPLVPVLLDVPP